jgi:mRNA interferase RelE/StbE
MGTLRALAYTTAALSNLRRIEPKKVRERIAKKINGLCETPRPRGCEKVQGMSNSLRDVFRVRVGDYRVLYCENGPSEILVIDVGHRKHVYRNR